MTSRYLFALADTAQLPGLFKGQFLKGHREARLALVGRSNVGKSSLINSLLGAKLAYISATPGKTRAIHFYHWECAKKVLVDLPGYGYAKVSQSERQNWGALIDEYFKCDPHIERAVVVLDARHGPTPADVEALKYLRSTAIPMTLVMSKMDTLKTQSQRALRQKEVVEALKEFRIERDDIFWVSSHNKIGVKQLVEHLALKADNFEPGGS
jgi:GTP-binding protein